jgi:uncharacterized membrane-anchored protein YitT (DUF2179 family)
MSLFGLTLRLKKKKNRIIQRRESIKFIVLNTLGILVGSIIYAISVDIFIDPNHIAPGGFIGIAIILNHYFPILKIGLVVLLMNIPLFIIGLKRIGWHFLYGTIIGTILSSILIDILAPYLPSLHMDMILASIYGGFIMGVGIGIIFRSFGSTGGSDLLAQIIYDYTGLPFSQAMMIIDVIIIIAAGYVFKSIDISLYSIIAELIGNKTIDIVQSGFTFSKAVYIITENPEPIKEAVLSEIERGVTEIDARGGYTGRPKKMLIVVVPHTQISKIKKVVKDVDPNSFIIIAELTEVIGNGFKSIKERI